MGRIDFFAGMLAGWIAMTEEGRNAASTVMNKVVELAEKNLPKEDVKKEN